LSWLINKFAPVPTWDDKAIARLKTSEPESKNNKEVVPEAVSNNKDVVKEPVAQTVNTYLVDNGKIKYNPEAGLRKGIIYYTDNRLEERIAKVCRAKLVEASQGKRIISVSLMPIDFPRTNCKSL
jgi:hypothetical protein